MSEEKQEITGKRPCDGLRVDLKRCLLQVEYLEFLLFNAIKNKGYQMLGLRRIF